MASCSGYPPWAEENPEQQGLIRHSHKYSELLRKKTADLCHHIHIVNLWVYLISLGVIDTVTEHRLKSRSIEADQVAALLEYLLTSQCWKLHAFVKALCMAGQPGVVSEILRLNPQDYEGDYKDHDQKYHKKQLKTDKMPSSRKLPPWAKENPEQQGLVKYSQYYQLLQNNMKALCDTVIVVGLLAYLISLGVIDTYMKHTIESHPVQEDQVEALVEYLLKGPCWKFQAFLRSLCKTTQAHVVSQIFRLNPDDYEGEYEKEQVELQAESPNTAGTSTHRPFPSRMHDTESTGPELKLSTQLGADLDIQEHPSQAPSVTTSTQARPDTSSWSFLLKCICCNKGEPKTSAPREPKTSAPSEVNIEMEDQPLQAPSAAVMTEKHHGTIHYCSFVLADKFKVGDSDVHSAEYVQFVTDKEAKLAAMLHDHTKTKADVHIMAVSERKRMLFISIKFPWGLAEDQITRALTPDDQIPKRPLRIVDGTLHFRDGVSASMACDVVQKSHVPDVYGHKVDFETQFVTLKMLNKKEMTTMERDELEEPHKYQSRLQRSHSISITDEEIMAPGEDQKFVVIRGRAGIGKTTTVNCFMWKWAHGSLARHLKVVFLINLRILMAITTTLTLPDLLSRFPVFKVGQYGCTLDAEWLKNNAHRIGFILDGLDEVSNFRELWSRLYSACEMDQEEGALDWGMAILKRVQMKASTVLVTSRPFAALSCIEPTMMVEVMGLTRERVMEFIDRNVRPDRRAPVKNSLEKSPILLSVCTVTFYCAALCRILEDDIHVTEKLVTYSHITAFIIQSFINHSVKKAARNEILKEASSRISSLCQMAFEGLMKRQKCGVAQLVFDKDDFERYDIQREDIDMVREMGLFVQTEISNSPGPDNKQVLGEFVHLSIQEFIAMAGALLQKGQGIKETVEILSKSGQFSMSLLFLYALAFDKSNETLMMVRQTLGASDENIDELSALLKENIKNVSDDLQALQIVHETQAPEIARQVGRDRFRRKVMFRDTKLTVVDILAIGFLVNHCPSIIYIDLQHTDLDVTCVKEIAHLVQHSTRVKVLRLWEEGVDDEGVQYLADMLKVNRALIFLEIVIGNVTDIGVAAIAGALEVNTSLTELTIGGPAARSKVTDKGVEALATGLRRNQTLLDLQITSDGVTDTGVEYLATMLGSNSTLKELCINSKKVTDTGVESLATMLGSNSTLQKLLINSKKVTDTGVESLATMLGSNSTLQKLLITSDGVTDTGVESLATMLGSNSTLKELLINSKKVTDTGVGFLAAGLLSTSTLEYLRLLFTEVHEKGAAALDQLLKANTKVRITIGRNEEARRLRQHHGSRIFFV